MATDGICYCCCAWWRPSERVDFGSHVVTTAEGNRQSEREKKMARSSEMWQTRRDETSTDMVSDRHSTVGTPRTNDSRGVERD